MRHVAGVTDGVGPVWLLLGELVTTGDVGAAEGPFPVEDVCAAQLARSSASAVTAITDRQGVRRPPVRPPLRAIIEIASLTVLSMSA
jgi:hypothetical protein